MKLLEIKRGGANMSYILGGIKICNFGVNPKCSSCKEKPRRVANWITSLICRMLGQYCVRVV